MKRNMVKKFKTLLIMCVITTMCLCGCSGNMSDIVDVQNDSDNTVESTIIEDNADKDANEDTSNEEEVTVSDEVLELEKRKEATLGKNFIAPGLIDMSVSDKSNIEKLLDGEWDVEKRSGKPTAEMFDVTVLNRKITLTETSFMNFVKSFDGYSEYLNSDFVNWDFEVYPFTEFIYNIEFSDCEIEITCANNTKEAKKLSELKVTGIDFIEDYYFEGNLEDFIKTSVALDTPVAYHTSLDTKQSLDVADQSCKWVYKVYGEDIQYIKDLSTKNIGSEKQSKIGDMSIDLMGKNVILGEHTMADVVKAFQDNADNTSIDYLGYFMSNNLAIPQNNLELSSSDCSYILSDYANGKCNLHFETDMIESGNIWEAPLTMASANCEYSNNVTDDCCVMDEISLLTDIETFVSWYNKNKEPGGEEITVEELKELKTIYLRVPIDSAYNDFWYTFKIGGNSLIGTTNNIIESITINLDMD